MADDDVLQLQSGHQTFAPVTASDVAYTPTAPLTATDVQAAIEQAVAQGGGGGGLSVKVVRFPFAFDTPDVVLTGIPIYTPAAGEALMGFSYVSVATEWDGTDPYFRLFAQGSGPIADGFANGPLNVADSSWSTKARTPAATLTVFGNTPIVIFDDATPLMLAVTQGFALLDPVSTQGEGEIVLLIAP
jgi:hypothetical protein